MFNVDSPSNKSEHPCIPTVVVGFSGKPHELVNLDSTKRYHSLLSQYYSNLVLMLTYLSIIAPGIRHFPLHIEYHVMIFMQYRVLSQHFVISAFICAPSLAEMVWS